MQGNILKSHGRDHSSHLLITFDTETPEHRRKAREFLSGLVESNLITTALQQWEEAKAYRDVQATIHGNGAITDKDVAALLLSASSVFVGVMVSAEGYRALKLDTRYMPDDPSFLAGAKARVDVLQDPPVEDWEDNFTVPLHALVIVADDVADRLESVVTQLKELLQGFCLRVGEETGTAMRLKADGEEDPSAPVREHFGFVDGVSQPLFYARDIDNARTRRGGIDRYDPSAPLDQVLVKDPGGKDTGYGSYFVYRKLEQNVEGFRDDEMALAKKIAEFAHPKTPTPTPEDIALAGAYMVGRFQDGTPVVERGVAGLGSLPNNFTFDADPDGVRCPFQAHVRKSNPRGDKQRQFGQPLTQERTVRIVRRAISYGKVTLQPGPDDKVGLLFLCAQSSIADQFEFIQNQWANNRNFLREHSGLDPVIGQIQQDQPDDDTLAGHWPKLYGSRNELDFSTNPPSVVGHTFALRLLGPWVTMKGGEYFFVPSLSALRAYGEVQEAS
ncbi:Dyp-type peroxidase [Streptomyces cahuitamycinicus]|uniref:Peroxidase n=1 Tax=Streptomyces cahuitamycinicus TaxID=2070367 RepID=A0A2N8TPN6_9ACTN|nr:Dyp-type peroxidase [Streptomyces cahuitamycinicus]PNG20933.1 peroxidase [Streptomyces cahuitamycinicus]